MSRRQPLLLARVKVWLEADGSYAFGFGIAEILQAVERAGSIKQAASDLGKSYRYVWGRIKKAEKVLGQPLVQAQVGGKDKRRSFVTPLAKQLVHDFLAVRRRLMKAAEQACRQRFIWPIAGPANNE